MKISCAHASMQRTDSELQYRTDARRLFRRAWRLDHLWVTGTELAHGKALRKQAENYGYEFFSRRDLGADVWMAVDRRRAKNIMSAFTMAVSPRPGQWATRGILRATFTVPKLGRITAGIGHYVPGGTVNDAINRQMARKIGEWAEFHGRDKNLAFYSGDQNRDDRKVDTFYGEAPLTSAWDELGKHEPTGGKGGTLDIISSYNYDGRVKALDINALSDREFFMHSDHRLIEATFQIKEL